MKCSKCGAELTEDTKFCSYCGEKITGSSSETAEKKELPKKAKPTILTFWSGLDLFGKISAVSIVVAACLFIVSISAGKGLAVFFSVLQLAGLIVAILMHKNVIKLDEKRKWMQFLTLAIAILLTILNLMSYSWGKSNRGKKDSNMPPDATVTTPYDASECVGQDYSTVKSDFSSAGFTSVKVEKIEDLKPSESDKVNTVEYVSIDGNAEFTKGQEFSNSDAVVIRYHAYEMCDITIHVDFVSNLIFSTYDVNLLLNGDEKGTLEHGSDEDFEFSVNPGEYTITFESAESSSVKGEVTLKVDCNIDAAYKISCHNDKISVETVYVDRLIELAEGEVKMDTAASEYESKNYTEVETALKTLGFTNIKCEILYDIVLGWTDEGEVESVAIDGRTDYKKGEVFEQNVPVVITYHMKEEKDPNKQTENEVIKPTVNELVETETPNLSRSEEPLVTNLTADNCPDLAALLALRDPSDSSVSVFASNYYNQIIEFDGCVTAMQNHGSYTTRWDVLLGAGDFDENSGRGPNFRLTNVNYDEMNVTGGDSVYVGLNVHVVAKVGSYDENTTLFELDIISMEIR